jgi:hypothetical protein
MVKEGTIVVNGIPSFHFNTSIDKIFFIFICPWLGLLATLL